MGKLLSYSGTTTKIRAIKSRLLTRKDYETLAAMPTVTGALAYLKQKPSYQELFAGLDESTLHRSQVEQILTYSVYADFQKIYRFSTVQQRAFMDLYFGRYEIAIMKRSLRMLFDHRDVSTDLTIFTDFFNHHSDLDLNKLSASQTIDEFVENLKGSIYYEPMKRLSDIESPTLWDYEMALDLFYFGWFWKNGQKIFKDKDDRKIFMEAYGVKIDLLNMQWIYRSKKYYHMENSSIYAHLIPVTYHLTQQSIKDLVEAGNQDELTAAVRKTYYGKRYPELTPHNLDQYYTEIRHKIQSKESRNNPYSVATMISYLYEKEHEVDRLTTILECVRYGLPQEEIAKYINN